MQLEAAAKAGHLNTLPRMGEKFVAKLLKGIEDHRRNSSRFRIDKAREFADRIAQLILAVPGIETVTPAGSLRRGRETVGDLDLLATGPHASRTSSPPPSSTSPRCPSSTS